MDIILSLIMNSMRAENLILLCIFQSCSVWFLSPTAVFSAYVRVRGNGPYIYTDINGSKIWVTIKEGEIQLFVTILSNKLKLRYCPQTKPYQVKTPPPHQCLVGTLSLSMRIARW